MPGAILAERLALQTQMKTMYSAYRPFGSSIILAAHDAIKGPTLHLVEPSGTCYQYYGCASGRGKQLVRNEIEKAKFRDQTVEEALPKIAKILLKAQDEMKDKKQEIELSVIGESTKWTHKILDRKATDAITAVAIEEIENEDMEMS